MWLALGLMGLVFLANQPDAVLVELPLYSPGQVFFNSRYMLHSTRHWRPILNGYSGFTPRSYVTHIPADACAARLMSWRRA